MHCDFLVSSLMKQEQISQLNRKMLGQIKIGLIARLFRQFSFANSVVKKKLKI